MFVSFGLRIIRVLMFGAAVVCLVLLRPNDSLALERQNFSYDALGRLVNVCRSNTVNSNNFNSSSYMYDKADNRRTVTSQAGLVLMVGQDIWSPNRQYRLIMQTDGNLVLYGPNGATWATSSTIGGGDRLMVMQCDGNLVVYNGASQPLWYSGTNGHYGAWLALQDDGNLVIYDALNIPLWASAWGK